MGYCWCPICRCSNKVDRYNIDEKDRLWLHLGCGHNRVFQLIFSVYDSKGAKYNKDGLINGDK